MNQSKIMLNFSPVTNYDRILAEACSLLSEEERIKLSLELVPHVGDAMERDERAALEQAIEHGFEDFEKGECSDAREFAKQLSARQ